MKRQRRLRTRTRTAPRSRARSAEPCTFIMETARRGNAACTINVGFLVSASTATSHSRPEQARSRWCSVVVYKVVRIVGVRPAAEGAAGTVESDGRAGGSCCQWPPRSRVWRGSVRRARGPRPTAPPARRWPLARRARRRLAATGVADWFVDSCVYAVRGAYTQKPVVWTHAYLVPAALAGRIRRTLGCVYAAPWGAYTHPPA